MFVKNYMTDEEYVLVAVCDVCGIPLEKEEINVNHLHEACFWNLEIHAPDSKETLESLGFKEYDDNDIELQS